MAKGPSNTNKYIINQQYFQGGSTVDFKMGIPNSFYYSNNLDFRTFPSQMEVLPASRQLTANLGDLILAMDQDLDGVRYGVGNAGNLYTIDTSDNITYSGTLPENGSAGLLYSQITDNLYIPGQTAVSLYGQCTSGNVGNPLLTPNQFAKSASTAPSCTSLFVQNAGFVGTLRNNAPSAGYSLGITNPNQVSNTLIETYTLPTTVLETATNLCTFQPDIEPGFSIAVYCVNTGAGDWTLTLHDSLNNDLATVTIPAAEIRQGWNEFEFGKQVRMFVSASNTGTAATYHFHLTTSLAGDTATVATVNAQDLSSVNFLYFAYRLVATNNTWHPTAFFTGTGQPLLCIGNGEYLSTYNFGYDANPTNSMWQRHALTFRPGDEVTSMTVNYQYLVMATERRSKNSSRNAQVGALWFWDGSTNAPNFKIDIPMGAPYGLYTMNNVTYFSCAGSLYAWSGGQTVLKVRREAYQNTDYMDEVDETRINPNAFTSRYNILMMGYPSSTTDPNIDFGIWSWGAVELTYPNSYGLSYVQSPGILKFTPDNQYQLGCCVNFVDSMYSSWTYVDANNKQHWGLDLVDNFSDPSPTFTWSSLIFDGGVRWKQKMAVRYGIYFEPLPAGCTITPKWQIDRGGWVYGIPATEGMTQIITEMDNDRFYELQWGFDGVCKGATSPPVILSVAMEIDPLENEVDILPGQV